MGWGKKGRGVHVGLNHDQRENVQRAVFYQARVSTRIGMWVLDTTKARGGKNNRRATGKSGARSLAGPSRAKLVPRFSVHFGLNMLTLQCRNMWGGTDCLLETWLLRRGVAEPSQRATAATDARVRPDPPGCFHMPRSCDDLRAVLLIV